MYTSEKGVLYNKNKTRLIQYPAGKKDTSFTIPNSVTSIGIRAFWYYTSLTSITIPDSVTSIGKQAFWGCENLTAINVATGNSMYTSEKGVLYNKNKTRLIQYPAGKKDTSFIIPKSVTTIGEGAFLGCRNLTSVTFQGTIASAGFSIDSFDGDLRSKYLANGKGTYTTTAPGIFYPIWTKKKN